MLFCASKPVFSKSGWLDPVEPKTAVQKKEKLTQKDESKYNNGDYNSIAERGWFHLKRASLVCPQCSTSGFQNDRHRLG